MKQIIQIITLLAISQVTFCQSLYTPPSPLPELIPMEDSILQWYTPLEDVELDDEWQINGQNHITRILSLVFEEEFFYLATALNARPARGFRLAKYNSMTGQEIWKRFVDVSTHFKPAVLIQIDVTNEALRTVFVVPDTIFSYSNDVWTKDSDEIFYSLNIENIDKMTGDVISSERHTPPSNFALSASSAIFQKLDDRVIRSIGRQVPIKYSYNLDSELMQKDTLQPLSQKNSTQRFSGFFDIAPFKDDTYFLIESYQNDLTGEIDHALVRRDFENNYLGEICMRDLLPEDYSGRFFYWLNNNNFSDKDHTTLRLSDNEGLFSSLFLIEPTFNIVEELKSSEIGYLSTINNDSIVLTIGIENDTIFTGNSTSTPRPVLMEPEANYGLSLEAFHEFPDGDLLCLLNYGERDPENNRIRNAVKGMIRLRRNAFVK